MSSAKPPPCPPSVNAGPDDRGHRRAVEVVERLDDRATRAPRARSSAPRRGRAGGPPRAGSRRSRAPRSSTPSSSSTPAASSSIARFSAVCPPSVGQERVRALAPEHVGDALEVERLDVRPVGEPRVGHDRRRVRVDDDRPVAVLAQHLERLAAGVVELARLADHDRAGADHADRADVAPGRHQRASPSTQRSRIGQASCGPGPASGWNWTDGGAELGEVEALDRAVVERDVRLLRALGRDHGEAVVLARDEDAARCACRARDGSRRGGRTGASSSRAPSRAPSAGARGRCRASEHGRASRGRPASPRRAARDRPGRSRAGRRRGRRDRPGRRRAGRR